MSSATDLLGILTASVSTAIPHSPQKSSARELRLKRYDSLTLPRHHPESREAPQGRNQEKLQAQGCVICGSVPAFNPKDVRLDAVAFMEC